MVEIPWMNNHQMFLRQSYWDTEWMRAAPSMVFTSGRRSWSSFAPAIGSRQVMSSDFAVWRMSLLSAKPGGHGWFLFRKICHPLQIGSSYEWAHKKVWKNQLVDPWQKFATVLCPLPLLLEWIQQFYQTWRLWCPGWPNLQINLWKDYRNLQSLLLHSLH